MMKKELWNTKAKKRSEMKDPRHQSYITYPQTTLIYMGILKNISGIVSMRSMNEMFNEEQCIETLKLISGAEVLDEMPHYYTLNNYMERLDVENIDELLKKMIKSLIKIHLQSYWKVFKDKQ